ncbi:TetR/AcrR family transcriptional regulator [Eubacteriales bacterium OttesenSCG-928-A19]|nr:TetR/AcrR family transcriptional regulator [Eubacteriales bacterium OttesenSCG-928-A19]
MPKQTFFNLSEKKRQSIEQAALDEFSSHGFDRSNMNRIVEHSGIAKGSYYQYFEDKKDIYFHLVDRLFRKKMQAIEPVMRECREHSFSHNLDALFAAGLTLAKEDARLYRLGEDFATMQRPFMVEFMEKYKPETTDIYMVLLMQAKAKGELRENIDESLVAIFVAELVSQTTMLRMQWRGDDAGGEHITEEMLAFINHAILK